jgi:hypothetical protein
VLTENQHGGQRSISHDNLRNTESPAIKQEQGGAL